MTTLTLKQANEIIEATLTAARAKKLPPIGVAVLDAGGHLKAFQAEDGLSFLRVRITQAKAWGSLGLGVHSTQIAERYNKGGMDAGFIQSLFTMSNGQVVPLPGGVLVRDADGDVVGAVGVSGADPKDDEASAKAGISAAGWNSD